MAQNLRSSVMKCNSHFVLLAKQSSGKYRIKQYLKYIGWFCFFFFLNSSKGSFSCIFIFDYI